MSRILPCIALLLLAAAAPVSAQEPPAGGNAIGIGGGAGGMFGGRRGSKDRSLSPEGGEGTEFAVLSGLDWLSRHQAKGGSFDGDGFESMCKLEKCGGPGGAGFDTGMTGLALLTFLGYGETHKTPLYGYVVRNGLKYLKGLQDAEGCFGPRTGNQYTYDHALASLAMIEAWGLTESPLYEASAQNAVQFILQCRNPELGWRYGVKPRDNDTSATGLMVMALRSAEGAGLKVDPAAFVGAKAWLDKVTEPEYGRAGYTARGNGPCRTIKTMKSFPADRSEALTAMAILTRIHCGAESDDPLLVKGAALCAQRPPVYDLKAGSVDFWYWHFGTLAMFQVGGDHWRKWNEDMKKSLLGSQRNEEGREQRGSWDPADPWAADGGRIYSTAINTLTLETYYRYPRLMKRAK